MQYAVTRQVNDNNEIDKGGVNDHIQILIALRLPFMGLKVQLRVERREGIFNREVTYGGLKGWP